VDKAGEGLAVIGHQGRPSRPMMARRLPISRSALSSIAPSSARPLKDA
jgi:hypothetical protein